MTSLRLRAGANDVIHTHLCRAYPEEGCGVLLGRDRGTVREIEAAIAFENQRADSRGNRYLLSPEQVLAGETRARAMNLDVVGFFHSHPEHPARPSAFDLEHAWPYYSYLIASVEQGKLVDLRAWRLTEDRSTFEPETIELVPEASAIGPGGKQE